MVHTSRPSNPRNLHTYPRNLRETFLIALTHHSRTGVPNERGCGDEVGGDVLTELGIEAGDALAKAFEAKAEGLTGLVFRAVEGAGTAIGVEAVAQVFLQGDDLVVEGGDVSPQAEHRFPVAMEAQELAADLVEALTVREGDSAFEEGGLLLGVGLIRVEAGKGLPYCLSAERTVRMTHQPTQSASAIQPEMMEDKAFQQLVRTQPVLRWNQGCDVFPDS